MVYPELLRKLREKKIRDEGGIAGVKVFYMLDNKTNFHPTVLCFR